MQHDCFEKNIDPTSGVKGLYVGKIAATMLMRASLANMTIFEII